MDWKRLQEPSFVAATLNSVLLVALLASRPSTEPMTEVKSLRRQLEQLQSSLNATDGRLAGLETMLGTLQTGEAADTTSQLMKQFDASVASATSSLDAGHFSPAFDMVMVASRLAPSDPRLFDLVIHFIEKAMPSENEEVVAMAEDLLDRGDSLVHFQAPSNVEMSRKRLNGLRQSFLKSAASTTPANPLDSVRQLLTVAEDVALPSGVRSRAVEQSRSLLDAFQLDDALTPTQQRGRDQKDVITLLGQIENAEKQCVIELFTKSTPEITKWLSASQALLKDINTAPADKVPDISKQLAESLNKGFAYLQELMPYSKSDVPGASALSTSVEKQVKHLQRQKNWLYNQQVLRLIRDVESQNDWTAEDKIRHLAEVSEELLSPYVLRRHNDLWDKVFESLPDEDKKVSAVRLRILRLNE